MFKKKKQAGLLPGQDTHQLLEAMDKIANGNFEEADVTQFKNPVYAEKINAMLHAFKNANNPVVMRLNETMGVIGDNTLIKGIWRTPLKTFQKPWDISGTIPMKFCRPRRM